MHNQLVVQAERVIKPVNRIDDAAPKRDKTYGRKDAQAAEEAHQRLQFQMLRILEKCAAESLVGILYGDREQRTKYTRHSQSKETKIGTESDGGSRRAHSSERNEHPQYFGLFNLPTKVCADIHRIRKQNGLLAPRHLLESRSKLIDQKEMEETDAKLR